MAYKKVEKLLLSIFFIFFLLSNTFSQTTPSIMKAVALEKISLFITWPNESTNMDTLTLFTIVVLNQNSYFKVLQQVYKGKKIKGRNVKVVNISSITDLNQCDLFIVPLLASNELNTVLTTLRGKPILTVSSSEGFAEDGCFVNIYEHESKLRFEINQTAMEEAGFEVDYRLLRVSKIINPVMQ